MVPQQMCDAHIAAIMKEEDERVRRLINAPLTKLVQVFHNVALGTEPKWPKDYIHVATIELRMLATAADAFAFTQKPFWSYKGEVHHGRCLPLRTSEPADVVVFSGGQTWRICAVYGNSYESTYEDLTRKPYRYCLECEYRKTGVNVSVFMYNKNANKSYERYPMWETYCKGNEDIGTEEYIQNFLEMVNSGNDPHYKNARVTPHYKD